MNMLLADSVLHATAVQATVSWPWYTARAAGFVAAGLLILLMLSGIGHVTGLTYRVLSPVKAWAVHKAMALTLCVSIAVHVLALLASHVVTASFLQTLVPFAVRYTNGVPVFGLRLTPLAAGFGALAMYGVVIVVLSSLGWIETRRGAWRLLHYLSYVVMLLVFVHAIGVGTDLRHGIVRLIWIGLGFIVALAIASRLLRMGTLRVRHSSSAPGTDSASSKKE